MQNKNSLINLYKIFRRVLNISEINLRSRSITVFFLLIMAHPAFSYQSSANKDYADALKLNHVNIEIFDVFDSTESFYKYRIAKLANVLHINTRPSVVRRELLFLSDSMLTPIRTMESANNLRELGTFQRVHFSIDTVNNTYGDITVNVKDHFSTDIATSFSVEGGSIRAGLGFHEFNLAGRGYILRIDASKRADRSFKKAVFINPRFLGTRFRNRMDYIKFKDAELQYFGLNKFFYSQEIRWDMGIDYQKFSGKQYTYLSSDNYIKSDYSLRQFQTSYGKYFGKQTRFRIGLKHVFKDEYWIDPAKRDNSHDWKSHKISTTFGGIRRKIAVKHNIDMADIEEDVHTGFLFNTGIGFEIPERGTNTHRQIYTLRALSAKSITPDDNVFFEVTHGRIHQKRAEIEKITNVRFTYFTTRFANQTIAAKIELTDLDTPYPSKQEFLGETTGLRGYENRAFIGQRRLLINLEDRIFSNIQFWFIRLGGSLFIDSGKIWGEDKNFGAEDWHTGVGFGVRLGIPKFTEGIVRIDFAFNLDKNKFSSLSISKGSYFNVLYPIEIGVQNFGRFITN
ncbi:hypothetical protein AMJ80_09705 [bacterium SM23_31]|nr:MAG: hypothetical protein AMJ80_09705 [bacterium SM23_31]